MEGLYCITKHVLDDDDTYHFNPPDLDDVLSSLKSFAAVLARPDCAMHYDWDAGQWINCPSTDSTRCSVVTTWEAHSIAKDGYVYYTRIYYHAVEGPPVNGQPLAPDVFVALEIIHVKVLSSVELSLAIGNALDIAHSTRLIPIDTAPLR